MSTTKMTKPTLKPVQKTARKQPASGVRKFIGACCLLFGGVLGYLFLMLIFTSIYPSINLGALISPFVGVEGVMTSQTCARAESHWDRGFRCTGTLSVTQADGTVTSQPATIFVPNGENGATLYYGSETQRTTYPVLTGEPVVKPIPWSHQVQLNVSNEAVIWTHTMSSFLLVLIAWAPLAWYFKGKHRFLLGLVTAVGIVVSVELLLFAFVAH